MKGEIFVAGNGGWGTALAILLHKKGFDVTLWGHSQEYVRFLTDNLENEKFLAGVPLPSDIALTSDISILADKSSPLIVSATPSLYLRAVMKRLQPYFVDGTKIVSVTKGIENGTLMRASEIIADVLGDQPVSVLSGPSHAEEVAKGLPTTVVVSSKDMDLANEAQSVFMTDRFRVYTNSDMTGVEIGGATKNVIAIAAGICAGLGFGDNTKAALITRGLAETTRLGVALGAKESTFRGLAGIGDLITTCASPYGRNLMIGREIGNGRKLADILGEMDQVAEGVMTTKSVLALAEKHGVDMPITSETFNILFNGKDPLKAVNNLMVRMPKDE